MEQQYQAIFCIVNEGFSDSVMEAARKEGAKGGTVMRARGTANPDAEKFFNLSVEPEKEIVMILCEKELCPGILHGLYRNVGLATAGSGIAFALPVEDVVGLAPVEDKTAGENESEDGVPSAKKGEDK